jgi:hypothetical protein
MKYTETTGKICELNSWFFEKSNEPEEPLAGLTKRRHNLLLSSMRSGVVVHICNPVLRR